MTDQTAEYERIRDEVARAIMEVLATGWGSVTIRIRDRQIKFVEQSISHLVAADGRATCD